MGVVFWEGDLRGYRWVAVEIIYNLFLFQTMIWFTSEQPVIKYPQFGQYQLV